MVSEAGKERLLMVFGLLMIAAACWLSL